VWGKSRLALAVARAEYPPQPDATLGLRPHLVAEWLLTSRLGQHPELLHHLCPAPTGALERGLRSTRYPAIL
jgi:hypothetical protein